MVGRSFAEAGEAFFSTLQRAVSCVTSSVLVGRIYRHADAPGLVRFRDDVGAKLGRQGQLDLFVKLGYRMNGVALDRRGWIVTATGYEYRLSRRDQQFILTYHWHPFSHTTVVYPHLHVSGRSTPKDLAKAHLPTGQVTLIDILRLAITDLGVEPLRPDWHAVLAEAEESLPF